MSQNTRTQKPPRNTRRGQAAPSARRAFRHRQTGSRKAPPLRFTWILVASLLITGAIITWLILRSDKPDFNGERAYEDALRQVEFGPRAPGTEGHDQARQLLVDELRIYSDRVVEQPFTFRHPDDSSRTYEGTNIIASFNLRPASNRRVMLAAHWDTRATADEDPDSSNRARPVLGANDGASGVAVLLEMARIFKENPPREGVDIVLFDLEDIGEEYLEGDSVRTVVPFAVGSEYFAANSAGYRPTYGILLDMVGDKNLRIAKEIYSMSNAGSVVDRVWQAAARVGADAFVNERGLAVYDDHIAFLKRGIPVIDLIQAPFPSYWHTAQDTPDKISAASLQQVGDVLVEILYGD